MTSSPTAPVLDILAVHIGRIEVSVRLDATAQLAWLLGTPFTGQGYACEAIRSDIESSVSKPGRPTETAGVQGETSALAGRAEHGAAHERYA